MPIHKPLIALVALAVAGAAFAQSLPRELRERIVQAVVEVNRYSPSAGATIAAGSGTVVSPDGFILTNFHVIGDIDTGYADEWHAIGVTDPAAPDRPPEHRYWARYVAGEPLYDLAILQILENADETPIAPGTVFPFLQVGDSNTVYPGDPVFVFGYPGISGSTITFTQGSISGFLGEDLTTGGKQWIKTDAKLARGNSGGTAVDENGILVGIPTLRYQTEDGGYIEAQDYLRPVALAWPLLEANVRNVADARGPTSGGLGNQVASAPATAAASAAAADRSNTAAPAAPAPSTATAPAETADGRLTFFEAAALTTSSPVLDNGEHFVLYERALTAGVPVYVELTSGFFDPYLVVLDPDGELVLEVDDSPGMDLNVAERFTPASTGTYVLAVTSYGPGETGAFELMVREGGTPSDGVAPGATFSAAAVGDGSGFVGSLALGQLTRTQIAGTTETTPWHTYRIDVAPGTPRLVVDLASDAGFDLDLFVRYGEEVTDWSDDGDWDVRDITLEVRNSLVIDAPAAGPWYIDVVWYGGDEGAARYSLRAR